MRNDHPPTHPPLYSYDTHPTNHRKTQHLTPKKQQEVLDFGEFLQGKMNGTNHRPLSHQPISALEAAGEWVDCIEGGTPDLSTNKAYMEGFGEA